ncbi:MAG: 16S rRNA (adenine(1518)-N(6)/adenine(1519)-N(6)) -dimethyltransferase RsmA [Thermodesulfovibrionia bacterium]
MKRPLGQHFLFDTNILKKIIRVSLLNPHDTVVEIGPGLGTLTRIISEHAKRVIAIEIDKRLTKRLKEGLLDRDNVEIINADALRFPYDTIKERFKVVSNIPYNITTPLLFKLLEHRDRIISMTLLLQRELAERIVASPNNRDYGLLSISMQIYTRPRIEFFVSRKAFSPPPDVDSAVVHFDIPHPPPFEIKDEGLFKRIVKEAFSHRRKTILNSLKGFKDIKIALQEAGINPSSRPETLSINDFIRLTSELR